MVKEQFGLSVEKFEFNKKGIIKGIASNFNKPIMHGGMINIISPQAFNRSLASGSHIPLLNQHNMQDPIGVFHKLQPVDGALQFEASIVTESRSGADAYALAKAGALRGVSIGFSPSVTRYGKDKQGRRVRYLDDVELHEISLVTVPADKGAQIETVYAEDFDEASVEFDNEDGPSYSTEPIGEFDAKGAFTLLEERILKLEAKLDAKFAETETNLTQNLNSGEKVSHANTEAVTVEENHLSLIQQLEEMQRDLMLKEITED